MFFKLGGAEGSDEKSATMPHHDLKHVRALLGHRRIDTTQICTAY